MPPSPNYHPLDLANNQDQLDMCLAIKIISIPSCKPHYTEAEISHWISYCEKPDHKKSFINVRAIGVYIDNDMIGFVSYTTAAIENLFVLPQYSGQGIGSELLELAISDINSAHKILQKVKVRATMNAQAFYKAHGFKVTGADKSRAGFDIILMENS